MRSGVFVLLAAASAWAAPRVAVHPLVVVGGDARAVAQSRADFLAAAAGQPIQMSAPTLVDEVLAGLPGQSCVDRPGCLEKVCAETRAVYAVLATLRLEGPTFLATATVVGADGTVVKQSDVELKKDLFAPRAGQVQAVFQRLFDALQLGALPAVLAAKPVAEPPVATVAPVAPPPAPPVPVPVVVVAPARPPPDEGMPPLRIAGLVVGGVAVATAIGGAAYGITGLSLREDVAKRAPGGILMPGAENLAQAKALDDHYATLTGIFGAAGFVAATSAVMLIVSGASGSASGVSLAPVPGGAVVGVGGTF